MELNEADARLLLTVAASVIRGSLDGRSYRPTETHSFPFRSHGCFVSLHRADNHQLRGCVGRLGAEQDMLDLIRMASAAVIDDPRFEPNPVTLAELPELTVEISLLSPLQLKNDPLDFDLLTEGIYLTLAGRSGLFLPQVARETGWTKEQLLSRLCAEKMGLPAIAWKHPEAKLQTFTTQIIGPERFAALV